MIFDSMIPSGIENARLYLTKLCLDGKKVEIKEYKPKRTNLQNRYYWAIINFLAYETGNAKEVIHKRFAKEFLSINLEYFLTDAFDSWLKSEPYVLSTTELNTKEMTDYIEKIAIFVSDFGLSIPRPEDKDFEQFLNHYEKMI